MFVVIVIIVVCKIGDINYKKDEFIFGVLFCVRTQQQQLTHTHSEGFNTNQQIYNCPQANNNNNNNKNECNHSSKSCERMVGTINGFFPSGWHRILGVRCQLYLQSDLKALTPTHNSIIIVLIDALRIIRDPFYYLFNYYKFMDLNKILLPIKNSEFLLIFFNNIYKVFFVIVFVIFLSFVYNLIRIKLNGWKCFNH